MHFNNFDIYLDWNEEMPTQQELRDHPNIGPRVRLHVDTPEYAAPVGSRGLNVYVSSFLRAGADLAGGKEARPWDSTGDGGAFAFVPQDDDAVEVWLSIYSVRPERRSHDAPVTWTTMTTRTVVLQEILAFAERVIEHISPVVDEDDEHYRELVEEYQRFLEVAWEYLPDDHTSVV